MKYSVYLLESAEQDLIEIRHYIIKNFSTVVWQKTYHKIKKAIRTLKVMPFSGAIPEELEQLNISQYRQIISEKNRIIYEIRQKNIYIHIIVDARKEMSSFLTKRLLRVDVKKM